MLYPFDIVRYYPNPSFLNVGVPATIMPGPGSQATNYSITDGTLPVGLSLNTTTGSVTGTPTALSAATAVSITCLNADATTYVVNLIISVIDIPQQALIANQGSAQDSVIIRNYYETIFINDANILIANAQSLGQFEIFMDLPWQASFNSLQKYFQSLNYTFFPEYWRNNTAGNFALSFGAYDSPAGFPYYPRVGYPVISNRSNRVRISWSANQCSFYGQQWYPGYPTY